MSRKTTAQSKPSQLTRLFSLFRNKSNAHDDQLSTKESRMDRRGTGSDTSEFQGYLSGLQARNKKKKKPQPQQPALTAVQSSVSAELLKKCYSNIPQLYWKQPQSQPQLYCLDCDSLHRSKRKTEQSIDLLNYYLEEVNICIFNQVNQHSKKFVDVLSTIESMDGKVQENLGRLSRLRRMGREMERGLVGKTEQVRARQLRMGNMRRLIEVMRQMKVYLNAESQMQRLQSENPSECLSLLTQLRTSTPTLLKLHSLSTSHHHQHILPNCQLLMKHDFTHSFTDKILQCLTAGPMLDWHLFYLRQANRKDILQGTTDQVLGNLEELVTVRDKAEYDVEAEREVLDVVRRGWMGAELAVAAVRRAVEEVVLGGKGAFGRFRQAVGEFARGKLREAAVRVPKDTPLEDILQPISLDFYSQVLEYFSKQLQGYMLRMASACKNLITWLLDQSLTTQTPHHLQPLSTLLQSLFNLQLSLHKTCLQTLISCLNLKPLSPLTSTTSFLDYTCIFKSWQSFFTCQLTCFCSYPIPQSSPFRDRVYVLRAKLTNCAVLKAARNELGRNFYEKLEGASMREIKEGMEGDTWLTVDFIRAESYQVVGYLMAGRDWGGDRRREMKAGSSLSRRSGYIKREEVEGNQKLVDLKIVKNQCIVQGRRYKVTECFLLLLEILEEYLRLGDQFEQLRQQISSGIIKLTRFYNEYSQQLILNTGAMPFKNITTKNITSRHLCLCHSTLQFLSLLLSKITTHLSLPDLCKTLTSISTHTTSILLKLKQVLHKRVQDSLQDITLVSSPSRGTESIVSGVKVLFEVASEYLTTEARKRIFDWEVFERYMARMRRLTVSDQGKAEVFQQEIGYFFEELAFLEGVLNGYGSRREEAEAVVRRMLGFR